MKHSDPRTDLETWIDRLVNANDETQADRVLVEAVRASGGVEAAALWRPFDVGMSREGNSRTWWCVVARGSDALLPGAAEIEAVSRGELSGDSLPGRLVLCAGTGAERCILAMGGLDAGVDQLDWIEGLLHAHLSMMRGLSVPRSNLDRISPALPAPPRDEERTIVDSPIDPETGPSAGDAQS